MKLLSLAAVLALAGTSYAQFVPKPLPAQVAPPAAPPAPQASGEEGEPELPPQVRLGMILQKISRNEPVSAADKEWALQLLERSIQALQGAEMRAEAEAEFRRELALQEMNGLITPEESAELLQLQLQQFDLFRRAQLIQARALKRKVSSARVAAPARPAPGAAPKGAPRR